MSTPAILARRFAHAALILPMMLALGTAHAEDAAPAAPTEPAAPTATPAPAPVTAAPAAPAEGAMSVAPTIGEVMNAIRQDDCDHLDKVLKAGFNPNQYDAFGYTPLTVAALDKRLTCVYNLLEAGADPNIASAAGWTPLIGAAMSGASGQLMAMLMAKGADINAQNQWGCTALYYAAGFGAVPTVDFLLVNGAAYPGTGTECPTPMKIAEMKEYPDMIKRLKQEEEKRAAAAAKP
jgi:hypothetical protein